MSKLVLVEWQNEPVADLNGAEKALQVQKMEKVFVFGKDESKPQMQRMFRLLKNLLEQQEFRK